MGGKPRSKEAPASAVKTSPNPTDPLLKMVDRLGFVGKSDEEIFLELVRRGYKIEIPGGKIHTFFSSDEDKHGMLVPMQEYKFYAPEKSYLFKRPA